MPQYGLDGALAVGRPIPCRPRLCELFSVRLAPDPQSSKRSTDIKKQPDHYRYFDPQDRITTRFIEQHEPFEGYWYRSERLALDRARPYVAAMLPSSSVARGLDAGCGEGRLLPWIAQLTAEVIAIDMDPTRIALARARIHQLGLDTKVGFSASSITAYSGGPPFHLVLCSHVIEHIPTHEVPTTLWKLYELTVPGGVLVLSYTRAAAGIDSFTTLKIANDSAKSAAVSQAHFDDVASGRSRSSGVLPVRHFSPDRLQRAGIEMGWTERWRWTYHVLGEFGIIDRYVDRDELVNSYGPGLTALGRDVMAIWQRNANQKAASHAD